MFIPHDDAEMVLVDKNPCASEDGLGVETNKSLTRIRR